MKNERPIGVVLQKDPNTSEPEMDDLHPVGTVGNILRYVATSSDAHHIVCQGEGRFRLKEILHGYPFIVARVEKIHDEPEDNPEIQARLLQLKQKSLDVLQMIPQVPPELSDSINGVASASLLSDLITGLMDLNPEEKQEILETTDLKTRLDRLLTLVNYRLEVLRVSRDIDGRRGRFFFRSG